MSQAGTGAGSEGRGETMGAAGSEAGRKDDERQVGLQERDGPDGPDGPVVLVLSPHAGHAGGADAARKALQAAGVEVGEQLLVSDLDLQRPLGAQWRDRGLRAGIAAGGDGTVGAVASHLAGSGLPLGILPMGTSNDTARSLGIPLKLDDAARVIAAGRPTSVDAGQAMPALTAPGALAGGAAPPQGPTGAEAPTPALGAYFLHALTLGFNVQFARLATDVARRQRLGNLNYAASLLQALTSFQPVEITLRLLGIVESGGRVADAVVTCEALEVAAVNAPVVGGALNLRVPDVEMHDRLLDFVVFEWVDPHLLHAAIQDALAALARLPEAVLHQHAGQHAAPKSDEELGLALPGMCRYKARAAVIESARPLDVTLDGEVRAKTPAHVRVAPQPVPILLPAAPQPAAPHHVTS